MNMANFDSTKNPLQDMLRGVSRGEIQLPDFQRDWDLGRRTHQQPHSQRFSGVPHWGGHDSPERRVGR